MHDPNRIYMLKLLLDSLKQGQDHFAKKMTPQWNRALATLLGLAVGDALGAFTQFTPFQKHIQGNRIKNFDDISKLVERGKLKSQRQPVGIWTDDTSMALCLADNLLMNNMELNLVHLRMLFVLWFQCGLNNGGRKYSIGLGLNIKKSLDQFKASPDKQTVSLGNKNINGNGSLMRLAPIVIPFYQDESTLLHYASRQSLATHNGLQAQQCCRLLAFILCRLIKRESHDDWRTVLQNACRQFSYSCKVSSVVRLARSEKESYEEFVMLLRDQQLREFNKSIDDRNWDWKKQTFNYSQTRKNKDITYVGSYCMDALAMALHTVWHTKSFQELLVTNANMGGDCDTVGAIAGQIGGAIYGTELQVLRLYGQMKDVKSEKVQILLMGYKLLQGKKAKRSRYSPPQSPSIISSGFSKGASILSRSKSQHNLGEISDRDLKTALKQLSLDKDVLQQTAAQGINTVKIKYNDLLNKYQLAKQQRAKVNFAYSILSCKFYNTEYKPICKAIDSGDLNSIKTIIMQELQKFKTQIVNGYSIFYLCVRSGFRESVQLVKQLGLKQLKNQYPVHCAAFYGDLQVLKYLRELGYSLSEKNQYKKYPKQQARSLKVLKFLDEEEEKEKKHRQDKSIPQSYRCQINFIKKNLDKFKVQFKTQKIQIDEFEVIVFSLKTLKFEHRKDYHFKRCNHPQLLAGCFDPLMQKPIFSPRIQDFFKHKYYYETEIIVRSPGKNKSPDKIFIFSLPADVEDKQLIKLFDFMKK